MAIAAPIAAWMAANAAALTAASMAVSVVGTGVNFMQQSQQASETKRYNDQLAKNAADSRNYAIQQDQTRMIQEADTAGQKMFNERVGALSGAGTAAAAAAAHGVAGMSAEAMANEYFSRSGRNEQAITTTQNNIVQQLTADEQGQDATYQGRILSQRPVNEPSLMALGLGIGKDIAGGLASTAKEERMAEYYSKKP